MAEGRRDVLQTTSTACQTRSAIRDIVNDTVRRLDIILHPILYFPACILALIPKAAAFPSTGQSNSPSNTSDPDIVADAQFLVDLFSWHEWSSAASAIRTGTNRLTCNEKLSLALSSAGSLAGATTNAASGALTLLPTAGALIGSPTKELWVVYKLMPLAGILSMLLSLGGSIVPSNASDYELNPATFYYGGMIATQHKEPEAEEIEDWRSGQQGAHSFAAKVKARSLDPRGGTRYSRVWCGILLQCLLIGVLVGACWFTQSGSILVWWCKAWGWMFFWYLMVAVSSLLENWASVPFTHQWTLRISRAPKVKISEDAPLVKRSLSLEMVSTNHQPGLSNQGTKSEPKAETYEDIPFIRRTTSNSSTATLDGLESGYNCRGEVVRDQTEPWSSSRVPFYVIISLESVSTAHAILRVVSKAISVGVFAAGTAIFASAQLIGISVALTTLCLVLAAGVFGRVVAMWMASEMMKTNPVLHRVVRTRGLASQYIEEILNIDGLIVEILGHVIINGRCIARFNTWMRWASWLGILAGPYDVSKLVT